MPESLVAVSASENNTTALSGGLPVSALEWHNERRTIADLLPYEKNPRKLNKNQLAQLKKSLIRFNLVEIPAIDVDGKIIAGHQRIFTLKLLGRASETIDVRVPNRKLTAEEFAEYNLRSNKNAGEWDTSILSAFGADLLSEVGFSDKELAQVFDDTAAATLVAGNLDDVSPLPETAITKPGDLWLLGDHRLLCGDSTSEADIARLMDSAKADLIFTDPPYGIAYVGKTKKRLTIQNDAMSDEDFSAFLGKAFSAMRKVCDGGTPYYVCHADGKTMLFRQALLDSGFEVKQTIIWAKQSFVLGRQDYQWQHEPILYGWAAGASHRWYGGREQSTFWEFDRPSRSEEHPTMKPAELCAKAVVNSSRKGDVVLDLFGGSGSTLIACEYTSRKARLCEIDPLYCDVIVARWESATGRKAARV